MPEPAPRFNPLENFVAPAAPVVLTPPDAAASTHSNYALGIEAEFLVNTAPDCMPQLIFNSAPKPDDTKHAAAPERALSGNVEAKKPAKPTKSEPVPPAIAKLQRETVKARRMADFDREFRPRHAAVIDAICAAAPDSCRAELRRAQVFYRLVKEDAVRGALPDIAAAAEKYKNARLRSLANALEFEGESCKKSF